MNLIDKETVLKQLNILKDLTNTDISKGMTIASDIVDDLPSIDAIPIRWLLEWSDRTESGWIWNDVGFQVIQNVVEDWRRENGVDR